MKTIEYRNDYHRNYMKTHPKARQQKLDAMKRKRCNQRALRTSPPKRGFRYHTETSKENKQIRGVIFRSEALLWNKVRNWSNKARLDRVN